MDKILLVSLVLSAIAIVISLYALNAVNDFSCEKFKPTISSVNNITKPKEKPKPELSRENLCKTSTCMMTDNEFLDRETVNGFNAV